MTTTNFCYWLQGFFELNASSAISLEQGEMIKEHLNMVFIHDIDPKMGDASHQLKLNEAHAGVKPQLHELIPEADVVYSDVPLQDKPEDWKPGWKHSPMYGWYDPQFGVPRC